MIVFQIKILTNQIQKLLTCFKRSNLNKTILSITTLGKFVYLKYENYVYVCVNGSTFLLLLRNFLV